MPNVLKGSPVTPAYKSGDAVTGLGNSRPFLTLLPFSKVTFCMDIC